ncbi:LysE family translocator [Hippea jasoniae]|uniref:LysE family translocator n=1 Tax=Hippea jasoniae TaxID=944479 RepID=UPI000553CEB8|nr:LysE family translocator [Hippea jasoniae]
MSIELFLIGFVAALTPGPDILLIVQTTLNHTFKEGFKVLAGVLSGNAIVISILFVGFSWLGKSSYFQCGIAIVGGVYLMYIAYEIFKHRKDEIHIKNINAKTHYLRGLYMNLSNPKALIFFSAIITPFVDKHSLIASLFSLFCGIILAFSTAILITEIARKNLLTPKFTLFINTFSSILFFIFSLELFYYGYTKAVEIFL